MISFFVYIGGLVFQSLVDGEEMLHLLDHMGGKLGNVMVAVIGRIVEGNGNDLFVPLAAVEHGNHTDGVGADEGQGCYRLGAEQQYIQRIAVVTVGAGDEAVVCRVMRGGI